MFGNQTGGTFGTNSIFGNVPQTQSYFNSQVQNGTAIKFIPLNSTDTIQKGGVNTNVHTKIHSISAMKEYETKSFEELRSEDYQSNRVNGTLSLFGTPNTMFAQPQTSFANFGQPIAPQTQTSFGTPSLFGAATQQTNSSFGSKSLFTNINAATNSSFAGLNATAKPSMFGGTNTANANKSLFGPPANTGLFGGPNPASNQSTGSFFTNNMAQTSTNNFFSGMSANKPQTTQAAGLFGPPNTTQSSFGFGNTSTNTPSGIFGTPQSTVNKPFAFSNSSQAPAAAVTGTSLFTGTQQQATVGTTGGLFGQPVQSTAFGAATGKPNLFPSSITNTAFSATPAASQSLFQTNQTGAFGTNTGTGLFGPQQKPLGTFGATSNNLFNTASQPSSIFGANTVTNPAPFGPAAPNQLNGQFGMQNSQLNAASVSTVAPIGYNDPSEALMQQKISQMKFLNLIGNRPYGVDALFLGTKTNSVSTLSSSGTPLNTEAGRHTINHNSNLKLVIQKNDAEQNRTRRRVLNSSKPIKNLNIFNGFDDDEDHTSKASSTIDKCFFTKREDWMYLPPDALEKSRRSLNTSSSLLNDSLLPKDVSFQSPLVSATTVNLSLAKERVCSTPLANVASSNFKSTSFIVSPIEMEREELRAHKNPDFPNGDISKRFIDFSASGGDSQFSIKDEPEEQDGDDEENTNVIGKCGVVLTRPDYYIAPNMETLNKMVKLSDERELECVVHNLIIGRKNFGSIRFSGHTDVYDLNLDELVEINDGEVTVYPDDDVKPEIGDGLNKRAQVILHRIYPTDKATGRPITDLARLEQMNFQSRLVRSAKKMEAHFISYNPEDGVWIFEVDHFSKYRYDDEDDSEDEEQTCSKKTNHSLSQQPKTINSVISAEADSMTEDEPPRPVTRRFLNEPSNFQKMRQCLLPENSDDDDDMNEQDSELVPLQQNCFHFSNNSQIGQDSKFIVKRDSEEPAQKKFETTEMGGSILRSCNVLDMVPRALDDQLLYESSPHLEIECGTMAATTPVASMRGSLGPLRIPANLGDIRYSQRLYIPRLMAPFIGKELGQHFLEAPMWRSSQFRTTLVTHPRHGLVFWRVSQVPRSSPLEATPRCRLVMCALPAVPVHQDQTVLLAAALSIADDPSIDPLATYTSLNLTSPSESVISRLLNLCGVLWGPLRTGVPECMAHLARKQALSGWLRLQCRPALLGILVDKSTEPARRILACLTAGEVRLAATIATAARMPRLALLIASCHSSTGRLQLQQQLHKWTVSRTDLHVPMDILAIYLLLSGQSSLLLSDGISEVRPLENLRWEAALGCHLWYMQPALAAIHTAVSSYEADPSAPSPLPAQQHPFTDTCYQLLALYCGSGVSMAAVLNPCGLSLGHRLADDWTEIWHLATLLNGLNYHGAAEMKHLTGLHYAAQLERQGLWRWAVFVLLQSAVSSGRLGCVAPVVRDMVHRHAALSSPSNSLSAAELFVVNRLSASKSETVIYEGKALLASVRPGTVCAETEAQWWQRAGRCDKADALTLDRVLPRLLIEERHEAMLCVLSRCTNEGAGMYARYVQLTTGLRALRGANRLLEHAAIGQPAAATGGEYICEDVNVKLDSLRVQTNQLRLQVREFRADNDEKRVVKHQIEVMCQKVADICSKV